MDPYGLASDSATSYPADLMNDPIIGPLRASDRTMTTGEGDTCRICRSEGSDAEPLFYPCKCSGSIKFVHQDCLMEWLSHSNKKHCELCKTPFRFTKLYDSHMPTKLPLHIFMRKAALHTLRYILTWARGLAVALVWLVLLPWCIRWSWRCLFWLLDAGWARDAWLAREENVELHTAHAPSLAETVEATLNATSPSAVHADASAEEPLVLNFSKMLVSALLNPWRPFSSYKTIDHADSASILANAASSSLLSDMQSLNSLTSSPQLNRFILDVLEGQIVTFLIVIAFILVFLIREWVVQQQPIINAAAQLRDAELQIEVVDNAADRLRNRHFQPQQARVEEVADVLDRIVQDAAQHDPGHGLADDTESNGSTVDAQHIDVPVALPPGDGAIHEAPVSHAAARADDPQEGAETARGRPALPPRGSSASVNQIREFMEEETRHEESRIPRHRDTGSTDSGDSWHAIEDLGRRGSASSRDGPVGMNAQYESNSEGLVRAPREVYRRAETNARSSHEALPDYTIMEEDEPNTDEAAQPQVHGDEARLHSTNDNREDGEQGEFFQAEAPASLNEDNLEEAASADSAHQDREVPEGSSTQAAAQIQGHGQTNPVEPAQLDISQRIFNWFWGDIEPDADDAAPAVDPFDEAIMQNEAEEAPFVRFADDDGDARPALPNDDQVRDPEVMQAAAEAGIDADAMDDVEDLEGILELIGMQGPLVGLLQTAMFCGVLITTTLWAALGAPYLFGKLALLFLGDPLVFSIMAPIRMVSLICDAVVDSTIYVGGLVTYFAAQLMSQLSAWVMQATLMKVEARSFDFLATRAKTAIHAAGGRLSNLFVGESPFETGFLMVSLHAHQSLKTLQLETAQATAFIVRVSATISRHLQNSTVGQVLKSVAALLARELGQAKKYYEWARESLPSSFATSMNNVGTLTVSVNRDPAPLDPSLAYWSASDRCVTIFAGYVFLAMIGTMYLLRTEPLFSSPGLQKAEKAFADFLKQAGGVLKVILIISIEMLAFPLYCGMLLDYALLPLFADVSVGSRLLFGMRSPWMFAFVHWFIGTCYMFHFALFVSACRRVMRSGVLYFIRDPDDPTFHPVRDVLERNVTTQLRKIAFSALVYGGLVICCLGGVVWGIDAVFTGVFPMRWATPEPILEFPIDFLAYNLLAPLVTRYLIPSQGLEDLFKLWLRRCARALRLSHFLFGDRKEDEEGHYVKQKSTGSEHTVETTFVHDGKYVRAPASDQVRIPKGDRVFLEVTAENKRVDGQTDSRTGLHGRKNKNFTKVYIPPWFRVRIGLFIFSLWFFAAATGVGITVVPMVFGRMLFSWLLPAWVELNDIYTFSTGLLILGGGLWLLLRSKDAYNTVRENMSKDVLMANVHSIGDRAMRALRSLYVYGFALVVVPTLFALVLQLYLIVPLHTYTASWSANYKNVTGGPGGHANVTEATSNTLMSVQPTTLVADHTIHVLQDWTLGFVYGRVVLRLLALSRNSRPATALRLITRDGYTNPDAKLATRAFIAPTLLFFAIVLLFPPIFATLANSVLFAINFPTDSFPKAFRIKVYRYSYPLCASQALVLWGMWELVKATQRWRVRIKDEVYLIGERLHNFGERRPPDGSKSAFRRER